MSGDRAGSSGHKRTVELPAAPVPNAEPTPAVQPAPSLVVDDRYLIEEVIEEGGMGIVYRAMQRSVQRRVAIKVLRSEFARDDAMVERFGREAASISRLSHPNIVTLLDFGRAHNGSLFMALEYVKGIDLAKRIAGGSRLAVDEAVEITTQILAALEHAHAQGIVHRDLKPENVILVEAAGHRNFVKLLDFGVAKIFSQWKEEKSLTQQGFVVGTPAYMAPEQALGEPVDARTDIYAVGLMLYEMLEGRRPFLDAPCTIDVLMRSISVPPRALSAETMGRAPRSVCDAIMRALAKKPDERFQSAEEMRRALGGNGQREAIGVTSKEALGKPGRAREASLASGEIVGAIRRRSIWIGVTLALAGGFLALAVVLFAMQKESNVERAAASATAPATERLEATGLSLDARDTHVLPQASGLKPSSAPTPARRRLAPSSVSSPRAKAAPGPAVAREPASVALTVRVRCTDTGNLCFSKRISLDGGNAQEGKLATFKTRVGTHAVAVEKDGFKPARREVRLKLPEEEVTIDLERSR